MTLKQVEPKNIKIWTTDVKRVMLGSTQVRPVVKPYFEFWDWTNTTWTTFWTQWTITKYSDRITFANSSGYTNNELSQYPVDWTKDFLLEFRADIPDTRQGYDRVGLNKTWTNLGWICIGVNREQRGKLYINVDGVNWWSSETNSGTKDFFIRREWSTISAWWDGVTKYTTTYTWTYGLTLAEQGYRDWGTLTIYTAKLTYL